MRISRLYLPLTLAEGQQLELDHDTAHYVRNVLRLKKSSTILVFNGQGGQWSATLLEVHKKRVLVAVGQWQQVACEASLTIHLGLAVVRSERMDWALQKVVEMGVAKITPILSERCVVQLKADKVTQKNAHWQRIIQNAAEQCGRAELPGLGNPINLNDWLEQQSGLCLFFDPYAGNSLSQLQPESPQVTLLAGPEGGFSEHERDRVKLSGFKAVKLGPRILRTETAALSAITAVQTLWGDYR